MRIDNDSFEKGFAAAARLRQLLTDGDLNDPRVAAEAEHLSGLLRIIMAEALRILREELSRKGRHPAARKTLEAMGLTREEVQRLADAFLAIYEDRPEAQA